MSRLAGALRLDSFTWYWLASEAKWAGSTSIVAIAYVVLASDRFGWPVYRATTRVLLIGLYGWAWLALGTAVTVWVVFGKTGSLGALGRLVGHAHLPLLVVAIFIKVVATTFEVFGVARWPAAFAGLVWMPGMLTAAVSAWSGIELRQAVAAAAIPYAVWVVVVGRFLWHQLAHLL